MGFFVLSAPQEPFLACYKRIRVNQVEIYHKRTYCKSKSARITHGKKKRKTSIKNPVCCPESVHVQKNTAITDIAEWHIAEHCMTFKYMWIEVAWNETALLLHILGENV